MKAFAFAAAITFGALFGLSAQAAPASSVAPVLQAEAVVAGATVKVQHWRWGSRGFHKRDRSHWRAGSRGPRWGGPGFHNRARSHWRWGSRR
jgi:hypothetical protein